MRSFTVSSILVTVIVVFQLLLFEDTTTSDTRSFLLENHAITTGIGDEHNWNHRKVIESVLSICPNCTFTDKSNSSQTSVSDTEPMQDGLYSYLRQYVHQVNDAAIVRNLDKFDMPTDTEGALVIVVQV